MIDLSWSSTLLGFAASFYFSWVLFAIIWFLILYCHGEKRNGKDKKENVDFASKAALPLHYVLK